MWGDNVPRVLVDTNVALTYVSGREDMYSQSTRGILRLCAEEKVRGFLAFHSLSTIWYVTRKYPEEVRRDWLRQICRLLTVVGADNVEVMNAIDKSDFKDFEDCLQDKCAKAAGCDYIITGNIRDYSCSEVKAVTPDEFMEMEVVKDAED